MVEYTKIPVPSPKITVINILSISFFKKNLEILYIKTTNKAEKKAELRETTINSKRRNLNSLSGIPKKILKTK